MINTEEDNKLLQILHLNDFEYENFFKFSTEELRKTQNTCIKLIEKEKRKRFPDNKKLSYNSRLMERIEEILNNPEELKKYVALDFTRTIDILMHDIQSIQYDIKVEIEPTIMFIDGIKRPIKGQDVDILMQSNIETIRKIIYEIAGLEYTPIEEIYETTLPDSREQMDLLKKNGYKKTIGMNDLLVTIRDFNIDELIITHSYDNITAHANIQNKTESK